MNVCNILAKVIHQHIDTASTFEEIAEHQLAALKDAGYTLLRPVTAEEEAANEW